MKPNEILNIDVESVGIENEYSRLFEVTPETMEMIRNTFPLQSTQYQARCKTENNGTIRVRRDTRPDGTEQYTLTVKKRIPGGRNVDVNKEIEIDIDEEAFQAMALSFNEHIAKERYIHTTPNGLVLEIDCLVKLTGPFQTSGFTPYVKVDMELKPGMRTTAPKIPFDGRVLTKEEATQAMRDVSYQNNTSE